MDEIPGRARDDGGWLLYLQKQQADVFSPPQPHPHHRVSQVEFAVVGIYQVLVQKAFLYGDYVG